MYFPEDIWLIIKLYQIDYLKHHSKKYKPIITYFNGLFKEIFTRWTYFPPLKNTNDMFNEFVTFTPRPNLQLTSICFNINANKNGGWWCGYGWEKINR